jgi:hypothetical protein
MISTRIGFSRLTTAVALALLTLAAAAQQPAAPGSTVSGHVYCADTNAPARFAKVLLKSTQPNNSFGDDFLGRMQKLAAKAGGDAPKPQTDDDKRAMAAASKTMNQATDMLNATTVGLDGAFSFAGVKPGTYYVHALFAGYIDAYSEFTDDDFASADPAIKARIAAKIPTITVTGTDAARADLRLDRGASVSGRILFDDGSPAAGWLISVVKPKSVEDPMEAAAAMMSQAMSMSGGGSTVASKTDDIGHFRISGLPSGEYVLRASLTATAIGVSAANLGQNGSGINLVVYSGDTFSRADAKSFSVTAGQDQPGVDLLIPAHKLHTITGHIYSKSDAHPLNAGTISLTAKDSAALPRVATVRDDGSFHFEYLPPATYTLRVVDASDVRVTGATNFMGISMPKQDTLHKYGTDSTTVTLADADIDTVRLTVEQTNWTPTAKKPGEKDPDIGDILGTLFSGDDDDKPAPKP